MAFQFGFAGDGDGDDLEDAAVPGSSIASETSHAEASVPVQAHKLEDLAAAGHVLNSLPERLSYSTVQVESPLGRVKHLLRRDLFDVRVQLLQEGTNNDNVIDRLENSDIREGVYEGGFKTWECSIDLASLLIDRGPRKDIDELVKCDQIVELGAGSALPSMVLFRHAIENAIGGITFTLADYNEEVLRLVTFPNLILNWAAATSSRDLGNEALDPSAHSQGELELTPEFLDRFKSDLTSKSITINVLSGPWSSSLAGHIPESAPDMGLLVLAAETIYSPASTKAFVDLLSILLRRVKMAKAIVGAKRIYFGVGGSVDGMKEVCSQQGLMAYEVENSGVPGMTKGVGRALIEVQMC